MIRKNEDRMGPRSNGADEIPADIKQMLNPMDFVAPTDIVDLPSQGKFYPPGHPLHGQDSIEIRFMTAKEEDMLTSQTLLKKGIAIDRVIQSLIKDKSIDASTLFIGDRNAILIQARSSAYGHMYKTEVNCPNCGDKSKRAFNLTNAFVYHGDNNVEDIELGDDGIFKVTLPISKLQIACRLLNGRDENAIVKSLQAKKKNKQEFLVTQQLRAFIVSVNGYKERDVVDYAVQNMLAGDSRFLRAKMKEVTPDIRVRDDFTCSACDHEQELEVPFGADFFWPDR